MTHALISMRAHLDLAKFDLEDGVRRRIAVELLASEPSISRIVVDIRAESQDLIEGTVRSGVDSLVWLDAEDAQTLDPVEVSPRLDEVAAHIEGWWVDSTEVRDLEREWVGVSTPGVKVVFFLRRVDDANDFESWLADATQTAASRMVAGGASFHRVLAEYVPSSPVDALVAFWFPTEARLVEAEAHGVFDAIVSDRHVDSEAADRLVVFEHRLHPNENTRLPETSLGIDR
ncbi:MAG: hypothetical protein ACR2P0_07325 [Acidimicrobiales bacterium]